ncbi:hypothetical protein F5J12DRAFT_3670 [Pisolithus orientalis]|uniref:uncharacterized protein n=1 Tax=Pisolithus orientalis TaxID=936130 RepID=UPI002224CDC1|nr:uncharacterized protein F5J12DRAFT_3670 [Pisolithus orientalis]KAI6034905.1 hypothetical protein F5J12DRAFT_3670 [Pisolithus orientalis]
MIVTDSVSVFAEGTFEEQIQELVEYATRGRPDDERASVLQSFKNIVGAEGDEKPVEIDTNHRQSALKLVLDNTKGVGEGTEQEIEGFFNLLFSHLLTLWPDPSPEIRQHVASLLSVLSVSPSEQSSIKYRVLSNLFNATPRTSALRPPIYTTLLELAISNNQLDVVSFSKPDIERWLKEWSVSDEEKSQFLKFIVDILVQSGRPYVCHSFFCFLSLIHRLCEREKAYEYRLLYVQSLPLSSELRQSAAVDAIAAALRQPTVFDFEPLCKLEAVIAAKDHELFPLLQIFLNSGYPELTTWADNNIAVLDTYDLNRSELERKIRLLAFSSLAFDYIGRDLSYSQIASTLQVSSSEVEKWSIDVIRAGLVSGKLSQATQTLHVFRSSARKFEREQWEALEKRLLSWKTGLASIIEIVANAQRWGSAGDIAEAIKGE